MPERDRTALARASYEAYETGDRGAIEAALSDDLEFFSPADPGIDRAAYFERCWPNAKNIESYEFVRLAKIGEDEVLVTYEGTKSDGKRFRNTEILRFDGDRI
jgi:ketosteroid isomerase-like protein